MLVVVFSTQPHPCHCANSSVLSVDKCSYHQLLKVDESSTPSVVPIWTQVPVCWAWPCVFGASISIWKSRPQTQLSARPSHGQPCCNMALFFSSPNWNWMCKKKCACEHTAAKTTWIVIIDWRKYLWSVLFIFSQEYVPFISTESQNVIILQPSIHLDGPVSQKVYSSLGGLSILSVPPFYTRSVHPALQGPPCCMVLSFLQYTWFE